MAMGFDMGSEETADRLWLLLVVVVFGGIAVAVVLLLRPAAPVDVGGTVVDARTGIGLQDVTVSGGPELATTDADGGFQVDAEPGVVLTFRAPGYEGSQTTASATMMVELEPMGPTLQVSSAMTEDGLKATVSRDGAELGAADEDGVWTVYAVSPGDRLVVEFEGYLPGEVTVGSGELSIELQPEFATSQAQIRGWVSAGEYGKALGWVARGDLDVPFRADSYRQAFVDEIVADEPDVYAAGVAMAPMGSNDEVEVYVVGQGQAEAAMFGWMAESGVVTFRTEGQEFVTGPYWEYPDEVVTMWWYDPILVLMFTDTEDEAEEYMTAVLRGQGLDIDSLGRGGDTNQAAPSN